MFLLERGLIQQQASPDRLEILLNNPGEHRFANAIFQAAGSLRASRVRPAAGAEP